MRVLREKFQDKVNDALRSTCLDDSATFDLITYTATIRGHQVRLAEQNRLLVNGKDELKPMRAHRAYGQALMSPVSPLRLLLDEYSHQRVVEEARASRAIKQILFPDVNCVTGVAPWCVHVLFPAFGSVSFMLPDVYYVVMFDKGGERLSFSWKRDAPCLPPALPLNVLNAVFAVLPDGEAWEAMNLTYQRILEEEGE